MVQAWIRQFIKQSLPPLACEYKERKMPNQRVPRPVGWGGRCRSPLGLKQNEFLKLLFLVVQKYENLDCCEIEGDSTAWLVQVRKAQ